MTKRVGELSDTSASKRICLTPEASELPPLIDLARTDVLLTIWNDFLRLQDSTALATTCHFFHNWTWEESSLRPEILFSQRFPREAIPLDQKYREAWNLRLEITEQKSASIQNLRYTHVTDIKYTFTSTASFVTRRAQFAYDRWYCVATSDRYPAVVEVKDSHDLKDPLLCHQWKWDFPWQIKERTPPTFQLCILDQKHFAVWGANHNDSCRKRPGPLAFFTIPEGHEPTLIARRFGTFGTKEGRPEDVNCIGTFRDGWYAVADVDTSNRNKDLDFRWIDDPLYDPGLPDEFLLSTYYHLPEMVKLRIFRGETLVDDSIDFSDLMQKGRRTRTNTHTCQTQFLASGRFIIISFENQLSLFDVQNRVFKCKGTLLAYHSLSDFSQATLQTAHYDAARERLYGVTQDGLFYVFEKNDYSFAFCHWKEIAFYGAYAGGANLIADDDFVYVSPRAADGITVICKATGRLLPHRSWIVMHRPERPTSAEKTKQIDLQLLGNHSLIAGFSNGQFDIVDLLHHKRMGQKSPWGDGCNSCDSGRSSDSSEYIP